MKKLTKILALLCSVICLAFCFSACAKEEYTYWQTYKKQTGETVLQYTSELSFGSSNVKIKEIWINLSKVNFDPALNQANISIELTKKSSSTPVYLDCKVTKEQVKKSKDGWVQLYFNADSYVECNTAKIVIVDEMRVNEICFIKSDAKLATLTFSKAGVSAGNSHQSFAREDLVALTSGYAYNEGGHYAFNIIDEQDKFPLEYIQTKA